MYQSKAKLVAVPTTLKHISSDNVQPSSQTNAAEKVKVNKKKIHQKVTFEDRQNKENDWKKHFWEASHSTALSEAKWKHELVCADKRYKFETELRNVMGLADTPM